MIIVAAVSCIVVLFLCISRLSLLRPQLGRLYRKMSKRRKSKLSSSGMVRKSISKTSGKRQV